MALYISVFLLAFTSFFVVEYLKRRAKSNELTIEFPAIEFPDVGKDQPILKDYLAKSFVAQTGKELDLKQLQKPDEKLNDGLSGVCTLSEFKIEEQAADEEFLKALQEMGNHIRQLGQPIVPVEKYKSVSGRVASSPINSHEWHELAAQLKYNPSIKPEKQDFYSTAEQGDHCFRVLPGLGSREWVIHTRQHYIEGRGHKCKKTLHISEGERNWRGNCVICNRYDVLCREGVNSNEARRLKPVDRYYYNVLDKFNNIKILSCGKKIHDEIQKNSSCQSVVDDLWCRVHCDTLSGYPNYSVFFYRGPILGDKETVKTILNLNGGIFDLKQVVQAFEETDDEMLEAVIRNI